LTFAWTICLVSGGLVYLYFVCRIVNGLLKLRSQHGNIDPKTFQTSVIIAARNEEKFIGKTLRHVLAQDYPVDMFEVIVVDDRSEDKTGRIVEEFAQSDPRVRLITQTTIHKNFSPKKQALERGIQSASGDIIITTDADCSPEQGWIRTLLSKFDSNTGIVLGQARFDIGNSPPVWQKLQALDFRSQGYAAAGLAADGIPFSCTGASLAFRREAYNNVEGYDGVNTLISGDDELLMSKISQSRWDVIAVGEKDAVVPTRPPASIRELWYQRIRWGSKGLFLRTSRKLTLVGIFIFFLSLSFGPLVGLFSSSWWLLGCMFGLKCLLDFVSVFVGKSVFRERINWFDFLILEIIHAPVIVVFAIGGHILNFEWKGQVFSSKGASS